MNCPKCAYPNASDALTCNLCGVVLRREGAPRAPAVAPFRDEAPGPAPAASAASAPIPAAPRQVRLPLGELVLGPLLLILGLWALVGRYRDTRLPAYPEPLTLEQIRGAKTPQHVRFDRALLRRGAPIYRSVQNGATTFTDRDPRVRLETGKASEILAKFAENYGKFVRFDGAPPILTGFKLTTKQVRYHAGSPASDETVMGLRLFGAVPGTNGRLWVISRWYPPSADLSNAEFFRQGSYAGTLIGLREWKDGIANLPQEYARVTHARFPEDAIAILDEPPPKLEAVTLWYPLGDADDVFVEVDGALDLDFALPQGIVPPPLDAVDAGAARDALAKREKRPAPSKAKPVHVITLGTRDEYLKEHPMPSRVSTFGATCLLFGLGLAARAVQKIRA